MKTESHSEPYGQTWGKTVVETSLEETVDNLSNLKGDSYAKLERDESQLLEAESTAGGQPSFLSVGQKAAGGGQTIPKDEVKAEPQFEAVSTVGGQRSSSSVGREATDGTAEASPYGKVRSPRKREDLLNSPGGVSSGRKSVTPPSGRGSR